MILVRLIVGERIKLLLRMLLGLSRQVDDVDSIPRTQAQLLSMPPKSFPLPDILASTLDNETWTWLILSGDWSGEFLHWNTQGEILRRFEGHTDWTRGFKVLDGRRLLSWSDDATLRLWNFDTGECTLIFEGHTEPIRDGALLDSDR